MKTKKILIPLMAVSMVAGAMPISNVSASNDPKIYVDLHYEDDGDIRADVMLENVPTFFTGSFHIDLSDSWTLTTDSRGRPFATAGCTGQGHTSVHEAGEHGAFVFITSTDMENIDYNGKLVSFYVAKSENFDPDNNGINVVYLSGENFVDNLYHSENNGNYVNLLPQTLENNPTMLGAYEYKVGDVNSDGYVDAVDCSMVWSATKDRAYYVNDIKNTYKSIFPKAKCAAAPDANQDGWINYSDGDDILQYYADMSTENVNNTNIGKIDIFELFDD